MFTNCTGFNWKYNFKMMQCIQREQKSVRGEEEGEKRHEESIKENETKERWLVPRPFSLFFRKEINFSIL